MTREEIAAAVAAVPEWFHSIDVGSGVITPGRKSVAQLANELEQLQLGDLTGLTVLDVGANDGYFSFAAEERGARRVVALDYFTWCSDPVLRVLDWQEAKALGCLPATERPGLWRPETKPGKLPFDTARRLRSSRVEDVVANFMKVDLNQLGEFDVVLFLGVLYHLDDPFTGLQRLAKVTRGVAYIETAGIVVADHEDQLLAEFYPGAELGDDHTNWWAPSLPALEGMCRAAGFARITPLAGHPHRPDGRSIERCRLMVRAEK